MMNFQVLSALLLLGHHVSSFVPRSHVAINAPFVNGINGGRRNINNIQSPWG